MESVMGNDDLLAVILSTAPIDPKSFVAIGRVCKQWRAACRNEALLLRAASSRTTLSKRQLMGLFALTSAEANRLPREIRWRREGGYMFEYDAQPVAIEALRIVGGEVGWVARLERRAVSQMWLEQSVGVQWHERQWAPRMHLACW